MSLLLFWTDLTLEMLSSLHSHEHSSKILVEAGLSYVEWPCRWGRHPPEHPLGLWWWLTGSLLGNEIDTDSFNYLWDLLPLEALYRWWLLYLNVLVFMLVKLLAWSPLIEGFFFFLTKLFQEICRNYWPLGNSTQNISLKRTAVP